jgi:hypothetical protein
MTVLLKAMRGSAQYHATKSSIAKNRMLLVRIAVGISLAAMLTAQTPDKSIESRRARTPAGT